MRADAKRNYDRIVEVAREVFREQGYDASLDEVAKRAGVGPGTLYRHFPNRDALLDAIMQSWVDRVDEAADKALAHEGSPRDLLLAWFEEYVAADQPAQGRPGQDHLGAWATPTPRSSPSARSCAARSDRIVDRLRERARAARATSRPLQMTRLVGGVATVADQSDLDEAAVRPLLEVVADGLVRA